MFRFNCRIAMLAASLIAGPCLAAETVNEGDAREIVKMLGDRLVEVYPFPEISRKYQEKLSAGEAAGNYKDLSEKALAEKLTGDLREVHKDVHLAVFLSRPEPQRNPQASREEKKSDELAEMKAKNFGFKSVQIDGETSTAYVDIPGPFWPRQETFEVAAAAMNMAAYSKYVILDLRHNPGGSGHVGRFITSYFYSTGEEKFYLNGFFRDRGMDEQEWTYSYVPGRRNPAAKVYILVGPGTASASEGLAFAMQKLGRATIVGDRTAGAGIAGTVVALKGNLRAFVPLKMVVAPHTTEGWEGQGVIPDVMAGPEDPLEVARRLISEDRKNGK